MFSTMESGATRVIRVFLVKRQGERTLSLPVELPTEMRAVAANLVQRPTEPAASNLGVVLSSLVWLEAPELDAIYGMPPSALASLALGRSSSGESAPALKEVLRKPRSWIRGLKSSAEFGEGRPIDFHGTTVEIWQVHFDRATRGLSLKQLMKVTEPRRKVASTGTS